MAVFDRKLKLLHKAAASRFTGYDYIHDEIASRLVDRLEDVKDRDFPLALDLGAGHGSILKALNREPSLSGNGGGIGGVRKLVMVEGSEPMLNRDKESMEVPYTEPYRLVADDTAVPLPFPDNQFDLVVSSMAFHWNPDLEATLSEVNRVLKPDGAFFLSMAGGDSLPELRSSLLLGETERDGGVSVHTGPFVGASDLGSLFTSAKFTLPTIDVDEVTVSYPNLFVLTEHLQRMGEGNAATKRRQPGMSRDAFLAAACIYREQYGELEPEEEIFASVQIVHAVGWKKHDSQQLPDKRGSGTVKIGEMKNEL